MLLLACKGIFQILIVVGVTPMFGRKEMFWANESWAPSLQIKHETKNCEDVVSKPFQSLSVREMWVMQTFCLVKLHFSRKSHSSRLRYFMAWQNLTNLFWSWFVQGPAATLNIVSTWSALNIITPPLIGQKEGLGNCSTPPHPFFLICHEKKLLILILLIIILILIHIIILLLLLKPLFITFPPHFLQARGSS